MTSLRAILLAWMSLVLIGGPVVAQTPGLPTVDRPRYAIILKDLKALSDQLARWGKFVGAVKTQIQTLQQISDGIRDLQGVVSKGVRGITGEIAASAGIGDILDIMKDVQGVYSDAQSLIHDVQSLPDEAKAQLKNIGMAASDVKQFLREGVMYDTLSNLGVDEWKEVAENPMRALQTGSFGVALARCDEYLSPEQRGKAWHDYIASLTPEEQQRMGVLIGPQFAAHLAADWFAGMQKRSAEATDYTKVANKLTELVDPTNAGQGPADKPVAADITTANAAAALRLKVTVNAMRDSESANEAIFATEKERTRILRELDRAEAADARAEAMRH